MKKRRIIFTLCALCMLGLCGAGALLYLDYKEGFVPDKLSGFKPALQLSGTESEGGSAIPCMSLDDLKAINSDVIGWLTLDGTIIDYPVVQFKDNDYYLKYTLEKKPSKTGTLFLDYRVHSNFSDFNNVIYGHNLKSGRMFGILVHYKQESWFRSHQTGRIYLNGKSYKLTVMGCLQTTPTSFVYEFDFTSPAAKKEHIAKLKREALYWQDIDISDKKLLTLSTCSYEEKEGRIAVIAVMSEE